MASKPPSPAMLLAHAPRTSPQNTVAERFIDPSVLANGIEPTAAARPSFVAASSQLPMVPGPATLGIPASALALPMPFFGMLPSIRPLEATHPLGMPLLHQAIVRRQPPHSLSQYLAAGDVVEFRVPQFSGRAAVDAIGIALLTGQGHSALYLCAWELSRLVRLPDGNRAAGVLVSIAATGHVEHFRLVAQSFRSYMHGVYRAIGADPALIDAEAGRFVRAANGYAMLMRLRGHSPNLEDVQRKFADARAIGNLLGLSKLLPLDQLQARMEDIYAQRSRLNLVPMTEVLESVEEVLATNADNQTKAQAILDLL